MTSIIEFVNNRKEILGMNDRALNYQYLNEGKSRLADNKLITKKILSEAGIPVPEVYGVIRKRLDIENFDFESLPKSFVLKPAKGLKGAGINIYYNRAKDGRFILADRSKHAVEDIKAHVSNILDGQFSMGVVPNPSAAIFEERIKMHNAFKIYSYRGIPDIRVIIYRGVPVMAMLRLPTPESGGKANISRGAIGVGIDMARGVTTTAIKNNLNIDTLPGTNIRLSGIKIPYWTKILRMSHKCQDATGLGFLGVDIIIDRDKGPMVVELNARPGLGIQMANQAGLKERLLRLRKMKKVSEDRAVRLAKDLFGGEIEEEIESISGREVIGLSEEIIITGKNGIEVKVPCKVDTGAESSSIDMELVKLLGYEDLVNHYVSVVGQEKVADKSKEDRRSFKKQLYSHEDVVKVIIIRAASGTDYRVKIELPAKIDEKEFTMHANIARREHLNFPMLLGKRDLKNFLIDTTKK
jgi:alpha-L-glutamate ligase-like protein